MTEIHVIRWNKRIPLPDGSVWNMLAKSGSREEVEAYAEALAEEHGAKVEAIV